MLHFIQALETQAKSMLLFYIIRLKKDFSQKLALSGFDMLKEYCTLKSLPFKQDGVLEIATYDKGIDVYSEIY